MKILHAMAAMAFKFPHENRQERRLLQSMGWNPDEHDDDEGGLEVMRWAIRVGGGSGEVGSLPSHHIGNNLRNHGPVGFVPRGVLGFDSRLPGLGN